MPAVTGQLGCRASGENNTKFEQRTHWTFLQRSLIQTNFHWCHLYQKYAVNSVHVEAISQNQSPTDSLGKCQVLGTEHEGDHLFCEGNTDPVPLVDQAKSMPPMGRHLLEGLPKWGGGVALDASHQPDLVKDSQNSSAQLVADIVWKQDASRFQG